MLIMLGGEREERWGEATFKDGCAFVSCKQAGRITTSGIADATVAGDVHQCQVAAAAVTFYWWAFAPAF
jgi:hypothetical protein